MSIWGLRCLLPWLQSMAFTFTALTGVRCLLLVTRVIGEFHDLGIAWKVVVAKVDSTAARPRRPCLQFQLFVVGTQFNDLGSGKRMSRDTRLPKKKEKRETKLKQ